MGREMKRRQERELKKQHRGGHSSNLQEMEDEIQVVTVLKVVFAVVLILFVLYFVIAVFITKEISVSDSEDSSNVGETNDGSGVEDQILASSTFNQKEEVYYVYYYDFNDEDENISKSISERRDLKIYRVDTSSSLNSKYVTEEDGNSNVTGIDNLKVKNPTLIQVSADKVTAYYEGRTAIFKFLNS